MIERPTRWLENLFFTHRVAVLGVLALVTVVMGYFAVGLRMDAGFDKQLPRDHEYTDTFFEYRDLLFGANRLVVVLHSRSGSVWEPEFLRTLYELTQAVMYMPGVARNTVTSIWTPNTRVLQITEEGFKAYPVIGGDIVSEDLNAENIAEIRENAVRGGYIGSLIANDNSGAMVTMELLDYNPRTKVRTDYIELGNVLEHQLRDKFENGQFEVQIIGFAKRISAIAEGAKSVIGFFLVSFALTALSVYWYCRSVAFTVATLLSSLVSLVWQFGTLNLLGYGLDPLAVLVPFLVFAIGVSHGVQQLNYISQGICAGKTVYEAARASFLGLLIPGTLALVTAFVGFATLILIPIPMIRELSITASIGVAFKIVTNLIMLPVVASFFHFGRDYVAKVTRLRQKREAWLKVLYQVTKRKWALAITGLAIVLFSVAYVESLDRHIGYLAPGAPELRADSRYNQDAVSIVDNFSFGLDVLTIVNELPERGCYDFARMQYLDDFSWVMANVPGVVGVSSLPALVKLGSSGFNEGNPKWQMVPRDSRSIASFIGLAAEGSGLYHAECSILPINVYLSDHKATTLERVVDSVKRFRDENPNESIKIRLASGNGGVYAATNEVLESSELPMMLYVYATIVALVFITYLDWRATMACCVPLTLATVLGYWFMKELNIGLTVATLPVMVLAVGIGVDYAFYIYNRLQLHLASGSEIGAAAKRALVETGNATIFTAITLSVGVAMWGFSELKFQADMGLLLAFMFMANMFTAVILLPALAVIVDIFIPRRRPVRVSFMSH